MSQNITEAITSYANSTNVEQSISNQISDVIITKYNDKLKELQEFILSINSNNHLYFYKDEKIKSKIIFDNGYSRLFDIEINGINVYDLYDNINHTFKGTKIIPCSDNPSSLEIRETIETLNHFFNSLESVKESILDNEIFLLDCNLKQEKTSLKRAKQNMKKTNAIAKVLFGGM